MHINRALHFLSRKNSLPISFPTPHHSVTRLQTAVTNLRTWPCRTGWRRAGVLPIFTTVCSAATAGCSTFFSWIGTERQDTSLSVKWLQSAGGAPAVVVNPGIQNALNLGPCANADDALTNPECRQYIDANGTQSYVYHRLTSICTDDCVQLRKTASDPADCAATGGAWQAGADPYCLYNAVPEQSQQCSETFAGCREYAGNNANNVRVVFSDNFEDSDTLGWDVGIISTDSVTPGGHSIQSVATTPPLAPWERVRIDATPFVDGILVDGETYEISFWARGQGGTVTLFTDACLSFPGGHNCTFNNAGGFVFGTGPGVTNSTIISNQWNRYTIGPFTYDEALALAGSPGGSGYAAGQNPTYGRIHFIGRDLAGANAPFFLDNVSLTRVRDNVYVIKDSWNTPLSCNNLLNDPFGASCAPPANPPTTPPPPGECNGTAEFPCTCSGPGVTPGPGISQTPFHLGCQEYSVRDETVTLKSFSRLCSDEAVGCQALIDTQNTETHFANAYNLICDTSIPFSGGVIDPSLPRVGPNGECNVRRNGFTGQTFTACTPAPGETSCRFNLRNFESPLSATAQGAYSQDYTTDLSTEITQGDAISYIVNNPEMSCLSEEVGCRALGNPNITVSVNPTVRITQGGNIYYAREFSGASDGVTLYNAGVSPVNTVKGVNVAFANESSLFVYQDDTTGKTNLFFRHDRDPGVGSGQIALSLANVSPSAVVTMVDDPGETLSVVPASGIGQASWTWTQPVSEGGIIEFDANDSWQIELDVTAWAAGPLWNFVSASGEKVTLNSVPSADPADTVRIEYNPTGFSVEGFNFTTDYIRDLPDDYDQILCSEEALWCEAFATVTGTQFFKDPRGNVCEWRKGESGISNEFKWYKKKQRDTDPDVLCPVTNEKTVGQNGVSVDTPTGECGDGSICRSDNECAVGTCQFFAGACSFSESSCKEYIDPLSSFASNVVFNGDFEQDVDGNLIPDGWAPQPDPTGPPPLSPVPTPGSGSGLQAYDGDAVKVALNAPAISQTPGRAQSFKLFPVILEPHTLYTISAKIRRGVSATNVLEHREAHFAVSECDAFLSGGINTSPDDILLPDNSMIHALFTGCIDSIGNPADHIVLNVDANALNTLEYRTFSGRFKTGGDTTYSLTFGALGDEANSDPALIGHWFDDVRIVKTGAYYNLADTIDKTSCNGVVDPGEGCVLFNERSTNADGTLSSRLLYDADATDDTGTLSTVCDNGAAQSLCDSNVILKVRQDRECAEWLTCSSNVLTNQQGGGVEDQCLDLGLCQSIDPNTGECNRTVVRTTPPTNVTLGTPEYPLDLAGHLTGYSKAGAKYRVQGQDVGEVQGLFPFDQMSQVGGAAAMENGNFEIFSTAGQPRGWSAFNSAQGWSQDKFVVIGDPVTSQGELGILNQRAPEGRGYLRVGSTFNATSDFISVAANSTYMISAWVNTLNLDGNDAEVRLEEYDANGNCLTCLGFGGVEFFETAAASGMPHLAAGRTWQRVSTIRTVSPVTTQVRLQLRADGISILGSFYYDDVQITPVLRVQDNLGTAVNSDVHEYCETRVDGSQECYIPPSCRLYPEQDSLACKYIDEAGLFTRGIVGYCIEHDPNNPAVCLEWWPIDQAQGQGFDEINVGYTDRLPLFMCLHAQQSGKTASFTTGFVGGFVDEHSPVFPYFPPSPWAEAIAGPENVLSVVGCEDQFPPGCVGLPSLPSSPHFLSRIWPSSGARGFCMLPNDQTRGGRGNNRFWRQWFEPQCNTTSECAPGRVCSAAWYWHADNSDEDTFAEHAMFYDVDNRTWWYEFSAGEYGTFNEFDNAFGRLSVTWNTNEFFCTEVAQVVTSGGLATPWSGRVSQGSSFIVPGQTSILPGEPNITIGSDFTPFGGIVPPDPIDFPEQWDGRRSVCANPANPDIFISDPPRPCISDLDCTVAPYTVCHFTGKDALTLEPPDLLSFPNSPHQVRAGTPYSCSSITGCNTVGLCLDTLEVCTQSSQCGADSRCCTPLETANPNSPCSLLNTPVLNPNPLDYANSQTVTDGIDRVRTLFAKSYGTWTWDSTSGQYVADNTLAWATPRNQCVANVRPPFDPANISAEFCGVAPAVTNAGITSPASASVDNTGFVTLSFNSIVDFNQLPLKRIKVDWGDGSTSVVSGIRMQDKPNINEPHQFFHLYSYWDLKGKEALPSVNCANPRTCEVTIRIQIQDNWNWCNATPAAGGGAYGVENDRCDTLNAYTGLGVDSAWTELSQPLVVTE